MVLRNRRSRALGWTVSLIFLFAGLSSAQIVTEPPAQTLPPQFKDVAIEQRLNQQLPLNLHFQDETGADVTLNRYFTPARPVILSLVYFNCSLLCKEVLSSLADSLRRVKFDAGREFEVITVSFDPHDTPVMAAEAKRKYLAMYARPGTDEGWHFLTGSQASISALTNAVGFHYQWDERSNQFAHAAGIIVLTPDGRVAQYYFGARFFPSDLRLGLVQASQNQIGSLADQIVLYCYHWDPRTGRYGAIVSRIIQISGLITVVVLGGILLFLFRAYPTSAANTTPGLKPAGGDSYRRRLTHEFGSQTRDTRRG